MKIVFDVSANAAALLCEALQEYEKSLTDALRQKESGWVSNEWSTRTEQMRDDTHALHMQAMRQSTQQVHMGQLTLYDQEEIEEVGPMKTKEVRRILTQAAKADVVGKVTPTYTPVPCPVCGGKVRRSVIPRDQPEMCKQCFTDYLQLLDLLHRPGGPKLVLNAIASMIEESREY